MKLEVGMYVRFGIVKFYIAKILDIDAMNDIYLDICFHNRWGEVTTCIDHRDLKKYNIKASHNIIDLIEVGDYVNGCLVVKKYEECDYAKQCIKLKGNSDYFYDIHVNSIVTKELFESMSYKVD